MLASVTVSRSDFGRMMPVYNLLPEIAVVVDPCHDCVEEVTESGVNVYTRIPDGATALLILGDRHEMLHWAHEALLAQVPIVHIGGGYVTKGSMDNKTRFALTELADIHCVANDTCKAELGTRPNVHVTGAPDIDMIRLTPSLDREVDAKYILVSVHPNKDVDVDALVEALTVWPHEIVVTPPGRDPGHELITSKLATIPNAHRFESVGYKRYINLMRHADCIIGNSSSGIIEASYLGTPTVDIGNRQKGRLHAHNVANCPWDVASIRTAITLTTFHTTRNYTFPFGDGYAAHRIVELLLKESKNVKIPKAEEAL